MGVVKHAPKAGTGHIPLRKYVHVAATTFSTPSPPTKCPRYTFISQDMQLCVPTSNTIMYRGFLLEDGHSSD